MGRALRPGTIVLIVVGLGLVSISLFVISVPDSTTSVLAHPDTNVPADETVRPLSSVDDSIRTDVRRAIETGESIEIEDGVSHVDGYVRYRGTTYKLIVEVIDAGSRAANRKIGTFVLGVALLGAGLAIGLISLLRRSFR